MGKESLIEPVTFFGHPYWAVPNDDEFECEPEPEGTPEPDTIVDNGSTAFGGRHLEADLEGLAIDYRGHRGGYLIVPSQGGCTFQVFKRRGLFTLALHKSRLMAISRSFQSRQVMQQFLLDRLIG